jgi:hypothetical protein
MIYHVRAVVKIQFEIARQFLFLAAPIPDFIKIHSVALEMKNIDKHM